MNKIQDYYFEWNLISYFWMKFKIIFLNKIQDHIFEWNSRSYLWMKFKIIFLNYIQNHIFEWNFNIIIIYKTALHLAAEIGNLEIKKILLNKKDIDINIEDSHGKKPIDYSEWYWIKQLLSKWFSIHFKVAINKNLIN